MVTYSDIQNSGISLAYFAKACGVSHCKNWKTRGIPFEHRAKVKKIIDKKNKELAKSGNGTTQNVIFPLQNNNVSEELASFLVSNRKIAVSLEPRGLQAFLNFDVSARKNHYDFNLDAVTFSANDDAKNTYLESYFLASVVRKIENRFRIVTPSKIAQNNGVLPAANFRQMTAANCGRLVMPTALKQKLFGGNAPLGAVDVMRRADKGTIFYHGLMICKDVWGCPTCAKRITERRKNGLGLLLNAHVDKYGQNTIGTILFTVPHGLGDDLRDILNRKRKAWRFMVSSTRYKNLMRSFGVRGAVRSFEVTYGKNGFHPHFHSLYFFDKLLETVQYDAFKAELFSIWSYAIAQQDLGVADSRAFGGELISTDKASLQRVADYFGKGIDEVNDSDIDVFLRKHPDTRMESGKGSWSIEAEMTKWHIKTGIQDHRYAMLDFLRGYAIADILQDDESRKRFMGLWLAYRFAFKGQRQLWIKHKDFKITDLEMSDSEICDAAPDKGVDERLASVSFEDWLNILCFNAKSTFFKVCNDTNGAGASEFLANLAATLAAKKPVTDTAKDVYAHHHQQKQKSASPPPPPPSVSLSALLAAKQEKEIAEALERVKNLTPDEKRAAQLKYGSATDSFYEPKYLNEQEIEALINAVKDSKT